MRPMLNPALPLAWRDEETLQVGADPQRAVVLSGVDPARAVVVALLDGTRTREQVLAEAGDLGLRDVDAQALIDVLDRADVLVDGATPAGGLDAADARRLAPDIASWGLAGARRPVLRRRRAALVAVDGVGRVGAALVTLLAAAGVGDVVVRDHADVTEPDLSPGGHRPESVALPRALSALSAARAAAPGLGGAGPRAGGSRRTGRRPDLVVLCPDGPQPPPGAGDRLLAAGLPHLIGMTYERVGVVGPLVRPGRTPCLRCLELHRSDRDRAWPLVAAQLAPGREGMSPAGRACDVVLATQVAAALACAALAHVDDPTGDHELAGGRLELRPPSARAHRRSWTHHPGCGCGWPGEAASGAREAPASGRAAGGVHGGQ